MKKGKRFTPARLQRWRTNGRGQGIKEDYVPWHMVTRDDPGSQGRSHQVNWCYGRQLHFLSEQEKVVFGFISMLSGLVDVREQFPLAQQTHVADVDAYIWPSNQHATRPGTLEIAADLGLKHPRVNGGGGSAPWVMTTDFVVTLSMPNFRPSLLAVSVKSGQEIENERTHELLRIEREYWRRQDVPWILVNESTYASEMQDTMLEALNWADLSLSIDDRLLIQILRLSTYAKDLDGLGFTEAINRLKFEFGIDADETKRVFWTAVWMKVLPIDLAMAVRPAAVIRLLPKAQFIEQNPVVARRTAWKG